MSPLRPARTVLVVTALVLQAALWAAPPRASAGGGGAHGGGADGPPPVLEGFANIEHVVFVVQENRSFDHYFGTFPGADGIPMRHGHPAVCVPDPVLHRCVRPYHDTTLLNNGGPHAHPSSVSDVDHGRMDGFVSTLVDGPNPCGDDRSAPQAVHIDVDRGAPGAMA